MVQDQTYFFGLLRQKVNELTNEITRLQGDLDERQQDSQNALAYEKKAEGIAHEIRVLQGELGDYNTLVDKVKNLQINGTKPNPRGMF